MPHHLPTPNRPALVARLLGFVPQQLLVRKQPSKPGASDDVFLSYQLLDSTVDMPTPTIVFDIVRPNAGNSPVSVACDLLDGRPRANPNIFEGAITKEQLLTGLEAAVAFRFKPGAPVGRYVMVISLFRDSDAFNPANSWAEYSMISRLDRMI